MSCTSRNPSKLMQRPQGLEMPLSSFLAFLQEGAGWSKGSIPRERGAALAAYYVDTKTSACDEYVVVRKLGRGFVKADDGVGGYYEHQYLISPLAATPEEAESYP